MTEFLWIAFEAFSNFLDQFLFIYLVDRRLAEKKPPVFRKVLSVMLLGSFLTLLKVWEVSRIISFLLIFTVHISYCLLIYKNSLWQRILWPIIAGFTFFFIDQGVTIFASGIPGFNSEAMMSPSPSRFFGISFHMFISVLVFYLLAQINPKNRSLPRYMQAISIAMAIICTVFTGLIFKRSPGLMEQEGAWLLNAVTVGFMLITIAWLFILDALAVKNADYSSLQMDKQRMENEQQSAMTLYALYDHLLKVRHDLKNQIIALTGLANKGDFSTLTVHLKKLQQEIEPYELLTLTKFPQLDAIISAKLHLATSYGIQTEMLLVIPTDLPLSTFDLCSVVGNILDNAIYASLQPGVKHKFLAIKARPIGRMWQIKVINNTNGKYRYSSEGTLLSTKEGSWHGVGLKIVQELIARHNGYTDIEATPESFTINILLPWEVNAKPPTQTGL